MKFPTLPHPIRKQAERLGEPEQERERDRDGPTGRASLDVTVMSHCLRALSGTGVPQRSHEL